MPSRPSELIPLLASAVALALSVPAARAGSCDQDCGEPCTAGCEIDAPDCIAACSGGSCPGNVTCETFGGIGCTHSVSATCSESGEGGEGGCEGVPRCGPMDETVVSPTLAQWAVIEYSDTDEPVEADDLRVVASSSERMARSAAESFLRREREQHRLREEARASGLNIVLPEQKRVLQAPVRRRAFWVDPNGRCERLRVDLLERRAAFEAPEGSRGVFFEVTTDRSGRIVAVEPLYSEAPELNGRMAAFLRESVRIWSESPKEDAHRAFLVLTVDSEGRIGYLLAAGKTLL